jgi:hypothetical protein
MTFKTITILKTKTTIRQAATTTGTLATRQNGVTTATMTTRQTAAQYPPQQRDK